MNPWPAKLIACLACAGKGYITRHAFDGTPYPVSCRACDGSGKQTVRNA